MVSQGYERIHGSRSPGGKHASPNSSYDDRSDNRRKRRWIVDGDSGDLAGKESGEREARGEAWHRSDCNQPEAVE